MGRLDLLDRWRDEDGPNERELAVFENPDRVWTEVTVAHLEDLRAASTERVELRRRLRACEADNRRLRDELRSALSLAG